MNGTDLHLDVLLNQTIQKKGLKKVSFLGVQKKQISGDLVQ